MHKNDQSKKRRPFLISCKMEEFYFDEVWYLNNGCGKNMVVKKNLFMYFDELV